MAEAYESLVAEIDRIVTSPYPTQLKGLRDIACARCTNSDFTKWALSRPCQVDRLAECLLQGLRRWPYVLELMTRLSSSVTVRDAVLKKCPSLLHDIVSQAVKAASPDSRYVEAAVTMLAHPLLASVCIPSEVQTLFVRLFDQAADEPSLPNIRKVHQLLKGTSSLLLGLLSSSSLLRLEQHLFAIIRSIKGENQSLSLYCLAIMRAMNSGPNDELRFSNSQYDTQELLASTQLTTASKWTPDAIQQFFSGSKAQKTVQLVVLRAMWSCTASTGEPYDERIESLLLANEVICAVPPHLREAWRKANSLIVGKLQDKVMAAALEPELRFQGLCFLAQVAEGSRVPATIIDGLRSFVTDPYQLRQALSGVSSAPLEYLMDAGVLDESTTTTLLQQTVDLVAGCSGGQYLEMLNCLQNVLQHIYAALASDTKVSEGTMLALDVISCGQKLRQLPDLVRHPTGLSDGGTGQVCVLTMQKARCDTIHSLCQIFLKGALCSPHQSYSISHETSTLLLKLHASSTSTVAGCSHSERLTKPNSSSFPMIEASSSPEHALQDWRETVRQHAQARALDDADTLTAVFANACADLEARCDEIEAPLKKERQKLEALQRRNNELEQNYFSLEAEDADRSVRFNAVELERDQYMSDIEAQREEIEGHERRIEELLQALQDAREEAERSHCDARHQADTAQMEHAAAFARKVEELEEVQRGLKHSEAEAKGKVAEIGTLREEINEVQHSLQHTKSDLDGARRLGQEHQDEIATLQQQNDMATARNEELSINLDAVKHDAVAQREAFERDLNDLKQQADQDLATASDEHEDKIAHLTREYEESAQTLRKQLVEMQDEVGQAREQHRADIEQWDVDLGEKQKKIDRLSRKCNGKDKQLAEANSMRTNLMAAMGLGGKHAQDQSLPHRTSRSSATQRTQYREIDSQDDPSPPTPFSGDDSQQLNAANTSFASNATSSGESRNGTTPKRPRPRKSIKAHSPAKPRSRLSVSTRSGARGSLAPPTGRSSTKMRQPLLGISGNQNRMPVRPSLKTPSKGFGDDKEMFDGSEIFAGTQGLEAMDLGAALDEEETETGL